MVKAEVEWSMGLGAWGMERGARSVEQVEVEIKVEFCLLLGAVPCYFLLNYSLYLSN